MRTLIASALVFAFACGGSKPPAAAGGPGSDTADENCCCKSNPMTSEDGKPVYETGNRIECSTKQGTCVAEVQCQAQPVPEQQ